MVRVSTSVDAVVWTDVLTSVSVEVVVVVTVLAGTGMEDAVTVTVGTCSRPIELHVGLAAGDNASGF